MGLCRDRYSLKLLRHTGFLYTPQSGSAPTNYQKLQGLPTPYILFIVFENAVKCLISRLSFRPVISANSTVSWRFYGSTSTARKRYVTDDGDPSGCKMSSYTFQRDYVLFWRWKRCVGGYVTLRGINYGT